MSEDIGNQSVFIASGTLSAYRFQCCVARLGIFDQPIWVVKSTLKQEEDRREEEDEEALEREGADEWRA
jgi:hypothetical protein